MGNTHDIRQVEPIRIWGALLAIKDGAEKDVELAVDAKDRIVPAFVDICLDEIRVPNCLYRDEIVMAPEGIYLILQSGASINRNYDKFRQFFENLAPFLEDCRFYVADELEYIDTYTIKSGRLEFQRLITQGERPLDVFLQVEGDLWDNTPGLTHWPQPEDEASRSRSQRRSKRKSSRKKTKRAKKEAADLRPNK